MDISFSKHIASRKSTRLHFEDYEPRAVDNGIIPLSHKGGEAFAMKFVTGKVKTLASRTTGIKEWLHLGAGIDGSWKGDPVLALFNGSGRDIY